MECAREDLGALVQNAAAERHAAADLWSQLDHHLTGSEGSQQERPPCD